MAGHQTSTESWGMGPQFNPQSVANRTPSFESREPISRQACAVNEKAGHQTSAESCGTGRAVARIPRVGPTITHKRVIEEFGDEHNWTPPPHLPSLTSERSRNLASVRRIWSTTLTSALACRITATTPSNNRNSVTLRSSGVFHLLDSYASSTSSISSTTPVGPPPEPPELLAASALASALARDTHRVNIITSWSTYWILGAHCTRDRVDR
ncbi:hypothetical protein DEU56DRAFT_941326 [Suillus clintonianus]|uniref:uncharacterized protein n=1 Tax=Suillus clintonianus TaxID=1904413 RepID=UPI001B86B566|nr:uncharacterized protein DEU56DRAFT_941326 [Suillus clintonianus]KAG2141092.1 hypothetical protein DEU56DRAFT_941326 [Suillus clintonianus]